MQSRDMLTYLGFWFPILDLVLVGIGFVLCLWVPTKYKAWTRVFLMVPAGLFILSLPFLFWLGFVSAIRWVQGS